MQEFIDKVEDFLEKGAELNKFTYAKSECGKVHHFSIGRESLTLSKFLMHDIGVLNGEIGKLPRGFTAHVINTLQPTEV